LIELSQSINLINTLLLTALAEEAVTMKEFIEYIAKYLVDDPEAVVVEETIDQEKKINLTLRVKREDIGKVIGKKGKTAIAMRTLLTAVAAKEGKRAMLEILD
jgi:predicted RNA-binding protein YlqC (UPF0109 family)